MEETIDKIVDIIGDYHHQHDFKLSKQHIRNWVNQFSENDRFFILAEFLHLLKQGIYVSKEKAKELLLGAIEQLSKKYGHSTPKEYLEHTQLLDMQAERKSQKDLLELCEEIFWDNYQIRLAQCGNKRIKHVLYLDDLISTGGTVLRDMKTWLSQNDFNIKGNVYSLINHDINLDVVAFCTHSWGTSNFRISLSLIFKDDSLKELIKVSSYYRVENDSSINPCQFNAVYPVLPQPQVVTDFLQNLTATKFANRAYRSVGLPTQENFFSSPQNRVRFENIILLKGVEILNKVKVLGTKQRPLGQTPASYKTFGTGTMFFTWRNISNTTPIVFWWDNPAHQWHGLFPLLNRGQH